MGFERDDKGGLGSFRTVEGEVGFGEELWECENILT